jgi:hypothetical protein
MKKIKFPSIKKLILNNWQLKLISLCLALILWAYVKL